MKEATGELNMTVITLVAVAAIGAIFYFVIWPLVQQSIVTQTCRSTYGADFSAQTVEITGEGGQAGQDLGNGCFLVNSESPAANPSTRIESWACCRTGTN